MQKRDKYSMENRPRCGACGQGFFTARELMDHLDTCADAQSSPEMALYSMGQAMKLLNEAVDVGTDVLENVGTDVLEDLARWQDDRGPG